MGPSLGAAFQVLSHDVLLAFANRAVYEELYGQSERVELLREVAGGFFGLLQRDLALTGMPPLPELEIGASQESRQRQRVFLVFVVYSR